MSIEQKGPPAPPLPKKQAGHGELYDPALMDSYRARFGLSERDMKIHAVQSLVKTKIDGDIWIMSQNKRLACSNPKSPRCFN